MKRTKRVISFVLVVLLIAVGIPFSASAASEVDSSLVLNRPKASMVVTEVTRVAYDETSFKAPTGTNSVIVKATPSGIPYTTSPNAEQGYAGETPTATTISFTPGVVLDGAPTISCNASVTISDYAYSNGTYTWTVTGGTAEADTFLIFTVSYTYSETNAVTGKTYTRTYQTQGTSYVTPISTPAGAYNTSRVYLQGGIFQQTKNRAHIATYLLGANTYGSVYNGGTGDGSVNFNSDSAWSGSNAGWTTEYGVMKNAHAQTSGRNLNFWYAADANRPVADIYLDKSIHSTLSDINLRLITTIPSEASDSGERVTVTVNGLYTLPGIVNTYSGDKTNTQPTDDASVKSTLGVSAPTNSIKEVGSNFKMYFTGVGPTTTGDETDYTIAINYKTAAGWTDVYLSQSLSLRIHTCDKGALRTLIEDIQSTDPSYMTTEVREGSPKGYNPQSWYYASGWETFLNAYNAAKACLDQPNVTQDQINACYTTLSSAHNALTFARADYSVVDQYLTEAAKLEADNYTLATWAKLQKLIGNYEQNYSALYQPAVDKLAMDIKSAMDNLKEADANYTAFNGLLANVNKIWTETESLYGKTPANAYNNWDGVVTALRNTDCSLDSETNLYVVNTYLPKSKQSTVDGYALVLENALNALSLKAADYTEATKAENAYKALNLSQIDGDISTELTDAYNALVALHGLDLSHQSEIDTATQTLNELLANITYKPANTDAAKAIIAEAKALDSTKYTNFSTVTDAVKVLESKLNLDIRYQSEVNSAVADVRAAINGLKKVSADYSAVEAAKTNVENKKSEALATYGMEASVLYSNWSNVESAVNAVVYDLDIDSQSTVTAYAQDINTALANLSFNAADYTKVNEKLAAAQAILNGDKIYTDETLQNLADVCNAVDTTKKIYEQDQVNAYATAIEDAIKGLKYVGADYSAVTEQLTLAQAELDRNTAYASEHPGYTYYTSETLSNLQAAIDAVDYTLTLEDQETVNGYATAISEAIDALTPAPADYTKVDEAIAAIPSDLTIYTSISVATLNATVKTVKWDLTADKQATVDKYATSINKAVAGLEYELANYTKFNQALTRLETLKDVNPEKYNEIKAYADTVKTDAKADEQDLIDEATTNIHSMLDAVSADYSQVQTAVTAANNKVASGCYTEESVAALQAAINAVDYTLNFEKQSEVDAYYTAIVNATNNLVPDIADYTEFNKALERLETLKDVNSEKYNEIKAYADSIKRDAKISEQDLVDEATTNIHSMLDAVSADYSRVQEAIAAANDKIATGYYTEESVATLQEAINAVDYTLNFEKQSEVDDYYTNIVNATDKLSLKKADYTELQKILDMLDNTESEIYTKEYSNFDEVMLLIDDYLTAVVYDNMNLTADKQPKVNEMRDTLQGYIDSLVEAEQKVAVFKAKDGSTTVIKGGYIYGLTEKLTKSKFLSNYVTAENVTVKFTNMVQYLGTGTKITVTSDIDGTVIGEYYVVIYGDVDGNGMVNYTDSLKVKSSLSAAPLTGAYKKAANVSGDKSVTSTDAYIIGQVASKEMTIDQVRGIAT